MDAYSYIVGRLGGDPAVLIERTSEGIRIWRSADNYAVSQELAPLVAKIIACAVTLNLSPEQIECEMYTQDGSGEGSYWESGDTEIEVLFRDC